MAFGPNIPAPWPESGHTCTGMLKVVYKDWFYKAVNHSLRNVFNIALLRILRPTSFTRYTNSMPGAGRCCAGGMRRVHTYVNLQRMHSQVHLPRGGPENRENVINFGLLHDPGAGKVLRKMHALLVTNLRFPCVLCWALGLHYSACTRRALGLYSACIGVHGWTAFHHHTGGTPFCLLEQ